MHHEVTSTRLVLGGRFELIRHLGGGGMSEVYLAEQRSLGRLVALKVLKRHLGEQWVMNERFRREAKLLSSVDHPSVVRVIDFESNETDGTVLVLEYAEGPTLEQTLASGPFDAPRAMRVLKQLAEGLALIHDQGIIHRDIKPQNVILSPTPAGGEQARLLDFGIARLIELHESKPGTGTSAKNDTLSGVGQAVGTPAYVAPEQAMAGAVTPRTDVYAFGVLAFRTLVGRLPFPGPETMDYLKQHVESPPPELLQVAPHLAPWPTLVKLVDACLTKRPESRPRDGRALLEALESAAPPSPIPLTTQTRQVLSAVTTRTLDAVQGSVSTLGQQSWRGARQVAGLALKLDRRTRWSLVLTLLATGLIPVAYAAWPRTAVEEATLLLENGDAEDALQVVDEALPRAPADVPRLLPLKVAALHQLGRFEEGREVVRATPFQALFTAPRPLLEALAEASADFELDPELNAWLHLIPRRELDSVFGKLARGPLSRKQWGALRWLDASGRADELDLVARYVAALASPTCTVRARAARRLGELGDKNAIGALRELSETPKEDGPGGPVACGQDDAADAIRRLKKRG
jgi:serine/threonine protein kinase